MDRSVAKRPLEITKIDNSVRPAGRRRKVRDRIRRIGAAKIRNARL